jgi:hypothetical protein
MASAGFSLNLRNDPGRWLKQQIVGSTLTNIMVDLLVLKACPKAGGVPPESPARPPGLLASPVGLPPMATASPTSWPQRLRRAVEWTRNAAPSSTSASSTYTGLGNWARSRASGPI